MSLPPANAPVRAGGLPSAATTTLTGTTSHNKVTGLPSAVPSPPPPPPEWPRITIYRRIEGEGDYEYFGHCLLPGQRPIKAYGDTQRTVRAMIESQLKAEKTNGVAGCTET